MWFFFNKGLTYGWKIIDFLTGTHHALPVYYKYSQIEKSSTLRSLNQENFSHFVKKYQNKQLFKFAKKNNDLIGYQHLKC